MRQQQETKTLLCCGNEFDPGIQALFLMPTCCFNLPFWFMIGVIIVLDEELLLLTRGISGMIWGMKLTAVRMPG